MLAFENAPDLDIDRMLGVDVEDGASFSGGSVWMMR